MSPGEKLITNICIIGGGPAGATTSIFLAKHGIEHVLVDAHEFPRDKVCGDGLDLNVVRVLNHIDPAIVQNELLGGKEKFTASGGLRFILGNGNHVDINGSRAEGVNSKPLSKPIFFVAKRSDFDALLVSKIDRNVATVCFGTKITGIERVGERWKLSGKNANGNLEIDAAFIVGADGDHSVVVKYVGERKIDRKNYAGALRQYWTGVTGTHKDNLLEIYFPESLPLSYFWIFPLPDGKANIGFGMASEYVAKKGINLRTSFEHLIKTDPVLKERFKNAQPDETIKGWGVPMSGSGRKPNGDGWLLVGDAASLVCPTSGEGIGSGMISGYIAAKFLERANRKNDFSENMFKNYNREVHKRLRTEEKLFRFANAVPVWAFTKGIKLILSNKYFKNWFANKEMPRWVHTAYHEEIKVTLD
jgi:geranylgeranyl reductase family protein